MGKLSTQLPHISQLPFKKSKGQAGHRAFTARPGGKVQQLTCRCGVVQEGEAAFSQLQFGRYVALWDTGCSMTTIGRHVAADLELEAAQQISTNTVGGVIDVKTYVVDILLPNEINIPSLIVADGELVGCDVLIGMDIIGQGDFAVSNMLGETLFSFQIPSENVIDFTNPQPVRKQSWLDIFRSKKHFYIM